jgi:glycerol uptake facilitator-like aquaporin
MNINVSQERTCFHCEVLAQLQLRMHILGTESIENHQRSTPLFPYNTLTAILQQPVQGRAFALPFTKAADPNAELTDSELRLPFIHRVPDSIRNHFIAMCGEFVGTVLFLYFALSGTQVANNIPSSGGATVAEAGSNPQQLQYIALCFGFSLAVNAWVFFRISGGLFNPAVSDFILLSRYEVSMLTSLAQVTLGMCLIGALPWVRGLLLFITQILGGMAAAGLVQCMFPGDLNVRTTLGGNTTIVQGLFIEMFLTAQLVFTIFMLAAEKHKGTFIAPVGKSRLLDCLALFLVLISRERYRSRFVHHRAVRCVLHRWVFESCAIIRSSSCQLGFRKISLDLLGWTRPRVHHRSRVLQVHQNPRIRDRQSRPGHGSRRESREEEESLARCWYQRIRCSPRCQGAYRKG